MLGSDRGELLKLACDLALRNEEFKPRNGKTYCNLALRAIARAMGCMEFEARNMLADDMCAMFDANAAGVWMRVDGAEAAVRALSGDLAIAAMSSRRLKEKHGHVAVIYPLARQYSGSLKKDVPMCMNIGRINGLMKVSQAFPVSLGEPDFFVYHGKYVNLEPAA